MCIRDSPAFGKFRVAREFFARGITQFDQCCVQTEAIAQVTRRVRSLATECAEGRLLVLGGGGYDLTNVARGWATVVEALLTSPGAATRRSLSPSAAMPAAVESGVRPLTATCAPDSQKSLAVAWPIPRDEPVTSTRLPENSM